MKTCADHSAMFPPLLHRLAKYERCDECGRWWGKDLPARRKSCDVCGGDPLQGMFTGSNPCRCRRREVVPESQAEARDAG